MRRFRRSPVALLSSVILVGLLVGSASAEPTGPDGADLIRAAPSGPPPSPEPATAALSSGQLNLQLITGGLSSPLGVVNAGDGTNRLFVLEKRGTVRIVSGGALQPGYFLDIRGAPGGISTGGERGLLGLAFHPSFETNRKLFVYYTRGDGDLVIAEMTANASRTRADVASLDPILGAIDHGTYNNHNGGQLLFGPDNNLYIFTGDGGGGGDPFRNAQDRNSRLGKVLRVTPNLNGHVTFPTSNPYVDADGDDAVWARGLRNPWRASFDRDTDALWIADVGQGSWEEINRDTANAAGRNYAWSRCEGKHTYYGPGPCDTSSSGLTAPVAEYGHAGGNCSVTGGYVYRGDLFPDMVGQYVLGDFCSGRIWTMGATSSTLTFRRDTSAMITSFGESEAGELYMTDYSGRLFRVVAPPFTDIVSSPFMAEIMWMAEEGITGGCGGGRFCPRSNVLRGQMASFLVRALDLNPSGTDYFDDDNSSIHEFDINALAAAGITGGCGPDRYCPGFSVNRAEMASFLVRALELPATTTDYFDDDEGSIHEEDINALAKAGITGGCTDDTFCPARAVTRQEMAAFLYRALP